MCHCCRSSTASLDSLTAFLSIKLEITKRLVSGVLLLFLVLTCRVFGGEAGQGWAAYPVEARLIA